MTEVMSCDNDDKESTDDSVDPEDSRPRLQEVELKNLGQMTS